ncbi:MAG: NYN domain-containing protein [Acidimicrobiales bacterium]|nr:NYN domain-containing protein [Acidimicrobiales bacterium]
MEPRLLRGVENLALTVALDGETADPPVRAPSELRPILGFARLTKSARAVIRRVLDEDEEFRLRVAEAADEDQVGPEGMLWLRRPDGWESLVGGSGEGRGSSGADESARLRRSLTGAETAAERLRVELAATSEARRRAEERATAAEADLVEVSAERDELAARIEGLTAERSAAVRGMKAVEAELASAREELNRLRRANIEAEAELAAARAGDGSSVASGGGSPDGIGAGSGPRSGSDREALSALESAAEQVDGLAASLHALARTLGSDGDVASVDVPSPLATSSSGGGRRARSGRPVHRLRRYRLPLGIREGTTEAARHLLGLPDALVLVDGYNVARTAWEGISPEEERVRTVRMLEEMQGRHGGEVVVVFDGADESTAPPVSRWVQVRFSPTGTTADAVIVSLVDVAAESSPERPVVVVTSDQEVVDAARERGASVLSSNLLLAARP